MMGQSCALMDEVIRQCTALGYRQMIAVIGDTANTASIALHARLGFRHIGRETAVGLKFGRWIDVVQMQLALGGGEGSIPDREPGA
jgi:phosphinothricin acetyltransferase